MRMLSRVRSVRAGRVHRELRHGQKVSGPAGSVTFTQHSCRVGNTVRKFFRPIRTRVVQYVKFPMSMKGRDDYASGQNEAADLVLFNMTGDEGDMASCRQLDWNGAGYGSARAATAALH